MAFADLEGVRLFYTDDGPSGAATPLLLVHGWGADGHEWSWHLQGLSADRRVITPDLRGHGYSSAPPTGFHPREMAGDLLRLLDHLGIDAVVAVGHSMGAQVVSVLAVEHPARVRALVCVEPGYGFDGGRPHVLAEAFAAIFTGPGQFGVRPAADAYLARRTCPVLSFWADPARSAWERGLFKDPASIAVTWPGSGHRLHEERPGEFVLVVTEWLTTLGAKPDTKVGRGSGEQDQRRGRQ